jgi:hypothetical protein
LDTVFLDANVLYSAAYMEFAGLAQLWSLNDVQLLSSAYAIEEAGGTRSWICPRRSRASIVYWHSYPVSTPRRVSNWRETSASTRKPGPILLAAIHGQAGYLLTCDVRHLQHLYGKRVEGVLVLRRAKYFDSRRR